jgi:outer membrane protein insertion porin family
MRPFHSNIIIVIVFCSVLLAIGPASSPAQPSRSLSASSSDSRLLQLEAIDIRGLVRVEESVVLRYLGLHPGDRIDVDILEQSRADLMATDYFTSVEFSTRPGSSRGAVILVIELEERHYPLFETGFGYHDLHGWFLTLVGLRYDHLFGIESTFRVGLRLGFNLSGLDLAWEKPAAPGGGFGVGTSLYIYNQKQLFFGSGPDTSGGGPGWNGTDRLKFQQDIPHAGGEVTLQYRAGRSTRFSFGLKAEKVEPDSSFEDKDNKQTLPFDDLPEGIKPTVGQTLITGFVFRMIRDTRNVPMYPTSGSFVRLTLDMNSTFLGGDEIFTRTTLDLRKHVSISNGLVLSGRAGGGMVSSGTPYYEKFYPGGIYSIRGFRELSLAPVTGCDGYWLTNLEARWPLIPSGNNPPRLTGLVFFDAGQGWIRGRAFSTDTIESAAGYGLRLRLPWLGLLGIDVGVPFSSGTTDDNFRVHGSIGFSF